VISLCGHRHIDTWYRSGSKEVVCSVEMLLVHACSYSICIIGCKGEWVQVNRLVRGEDD
jgi:hypothetical protein